MQQVLQSFFANFEFAVAMNRRPLLSWRYPCVSHSLIRKYALHQQSMRQLAFSSTPHSLSFPTESPKVSDVSAHQRSIRLASQSLLHCGSRPSILMQASASYRLLELYHVGRRQVADRYPDEGTGSDIRWTAICRSGLRKGSPHLDRRKLGTQC